MPGSGNTAKMLKVDLKAAGIEYATSDGVADFHALRHTFITTLAMAGERIKVVQELARHSKADLTLNVYTHAGLHDLQGAVDRLPSTGHPESERARIAATGTDGLPLGKRGKNSQNECMQKLGFSGHSVAQADTEVDLSDHSESLGKTESERDSQCQEKSWSDGESNPDLLNAIQPSSR